ncbi:VPS35 endosomal protein-sorting factor-like [Mytilus californianus]|uniref:VPS35 endosomal protein-sorting factor-like n=1 Tax=Mytilus californianus TaxID=6549 RepID=UPI0022461F86|nr:VPS35 endosomal protein-sorting factor-like [Mytilus californianus]
MATYEWFPRPRNYDIERNRERLDGEEPSSHPLKAITVVDVKKTDKKGTTQSKTEKKPVSSSVIKDPLSSMLDPLSASLEGSDPLSQMSLSSSSLPTTGRKSSFKESAETDGLDETFEPWSVKKSSILTKYSTSEKLSITTSFLSSSDKEKVAMRPQTTTTVTDKVRNRLEQLDDFEEGSVQEMLNLSQQDYVNRIDELNQALIDAWQHDQRVKALKIAIQCSKLLADISVLPFYPSKFVLITDILDTFGRLVYDRLKEKAVYIPAGSGVPLKLPDNFTPDQVPESAKETCRNWFFKIASIRELIPRFYVETAILKCYSYLNNQEYTDAINRLCVMTRGIGDPLVAIYAKCYLCRVGILIAPKTRDHILPCYEDFLCTYSQVQKDAVQNTLAMQKIEMPRYLTLFSPALDWLLQCIANKSTEKTLMDILEKSRKQCNNALLLNSIISAFKPEYIASRSTQFIELIRESEEAGFPKHLLDRTLGLCLVMASPPEEQRLPVLNEVWKSIIKLKNPSDYIDCAEVWTEYVVKHFGKREINTILADIIKHMTPDRVYEDYYPQLQSVVTKIMCHITNFSMLFSLDKFLPFIDMFQKESVRVDVCKTIMESFNKTQLEPTNDPVIVNALMFICKTMHDSVNALTLEDERKMISNLISGFVRKISFGRDFEQQLSFYVEARANFTNLDMVLIELVQNVNNLSIDTRKVVKGNHSRKTGNFVRACAAYCFITVPSLQSQTSQLQLYLLSGQVALLNQCFSQADSFFKAAISLIPDVPKDLTQDGKKRQSEPVLQEYICNFLSTLLTVPDNPDSGVLYLLRGLLNILQNYTSDSDFKSNIYVRVLAVLSAVCQESYPYHVDKVDSNDSMYGSDPKFTADVRGICSTLLEEVLNHLKSLHTAETLRRQSQLALELFNTIVHHGDVTKPSMFALALNLWNLAQKHGECDTKQTVRSLDAVKKKAAVLNIKEYTDLVNKMALESRT